MGYFDWHEQPGYWRDVTRHFPPETKLLDIGCGTAWIGTHFDEYTGIDSSEEAVEEAVARGINASLVDVAENLPFDDCIFDGVVMKDLLEHVDDPAAVVREARRVLVPGGIAFASSPDAQKWVWDDYTHVRPFTRRGFKRLFEDQQMSVMHTGYESIIPGSSVLSGKMPSNRRPLPLRAIAWLPMFRRNVWALARK